MNKYNQQATPCSWFMKKLFEWYTQGDDKLILSLSILISRVRNFVKHKVVCECVFTSQKKNKKLPSSNLNIIAAKLFTL